MYLTEMLLTKTSDHPHLIRHTSAYSLDAISIILGVISLSEHPVFHPTLARVSITLESLTSANIGWSMND